MPEPEVFSEQDKARMMANRDDYARQEIERRSGRDKARMWAGEDWQLPRTPPEARQAYPITVHLSRWQRFLQKAERAWEALSAPPDR